MLEHWFDHLPWNPLWWELIFVTLLALIVLLPSGRRGQRSSGNRPEDEDGKRQP